MPSILNMLLKSAAMYVIVFVMARILGKKSLARSTPFQFIVYIAMSVMAALVALGIFPDFAAGLAILGIWTLLTVLAEYLSLRSKKLHDLLHGKETVLVKQGKIMEESLKQARLTGEELLSELRRKSVFNLADVEFAVLEENGEVNVLLKSDKTPVTPAHLGQKTAPQAAPQTVILDGNIINERLAEAGVNRRWLLSRLEAMGISPENVFIGQVDASGELYVDVFDDSLQVPQNNLRAMIFASLEKAEGELASYALETQTREAQEMYRKNAERVGALKEKLRPYLLR